MSNFKDGVKGELQGALMRQLRGLSANGSFEHSSGYNSFDNGSSSEDVSQMGNKEVQEAFTANSQKIRDDIEDESKFRISKFVNTVASMSKMNNDNEEELKHDKTSAFQTMCKELDSDNETGQEDFSDSAQHCPNDENIGVPGISYHRKEDFVAFNLDQIIDTVVPTDDPTVVPTTEPTVVQNNLDEVDALERQLAFDESEDEYGKGPNISNKKGPGLMKCTPENEIEVNVRTNDEYKLEATHIDKLSSRPSQHPNLCSPISVEEKLKTADSMDSLSDTTPKQSCKISDSRDLTYDRASVRSDGSSSTSSSSISSGKASPGFGAACGRTDSQDTMCDGVSRTSISSADTLVSNSSEYKVKTREPTIVRINCGKTNFTRIETVKYKYKGKSYTQHYIKRLKNSEVDGGIELSPKDLLLTVEGKSVENVKQKKVLKIFKKIKPNRKGKICMCVTFRRWEKEAEGAQEFEVDYKLHLTLEPENDETASKLLQTRPVICNTGVELLLYQTRSVSGYTGAERLLSQTRSVSGFQTCSTGGDEVHKLKIKRGPKIKQLKRHKSFRVTHKDSQELKKKAVPRGQIDGVEDKGVVTGRLKIVYGGPDEYVTTGRDGQVLIQVPAKENENLFNLHQMEAIDLAPESYPVAFLTRISPRGSEPQTFLVSDISNGTGLKFKVSSVTVSSLQKQGDVDESFFIIRMIGDKYLFESLLYRGNYISVKQRDGGMPPTLQMVKKSKDDIKKDTDIDSCKFEYYEATTKELGGTEHSDNFLTRLVSPLVGLFAGCAGCRSSRSQSSIYRRSSVPQKR